MKTTITRLPWSRASRHILLKTLIRTFWMQSPASNAARRSCPITRNVLSKRLMTVASVTSTRLGQAGSSVILHNPDKIMETIMLVFYSLVVCAVKAPHSCRLRLGLLRAQYILESPPAEGAYGCLQSTPSLHSLLRCGTTPAPHACVSRYLTDVMLTPHRAAVLFFPVSYL